MPVEPILSEELRHALQETISEEYPGVVVTQLDGLEAALIGLGVSYCNGQPLLVYSRDKILDILIDQGMSDYEAWEYFDFNIACLYAGPGTPMILQ